MLKSLCSLEAKFVLLIALGCVVFFLYPLWFRISSCPVPSGGMNNEQNGGPIDTSGHPKSYQDPTTYIADSIRNAFAGVAPKHQTKPDKDRTRGSEKDIADLFSDLLCDARITDIALVYFTYCLVIVGWFTMRSGERTSKDLERAYLTVDNWAVTGFSGATSFRYILHNKGRTAGHVKRTILKYIISKELPNVPNYENPPASARMIIYDHFPCVFDPPIKIAAPDRVLLQDSHSSTSGAR